MSHHRILNALPGFRAKPTAMKHDPNLRDLYEHARTKHPELTGLTPEIVSDLTVLHEREHRRWRTVVTVKLSAVMPLTVALIVVFGNGDVAARCNGI